MKHYITSDIHFSHKNITKFCPKTRARFNDDIDYMNEKIIQEWNEVVENDDHTYILGDVAFCQSSEAIKLLNRMNGKKTLIVGNHDRKLIKDPKFRDCFIEIHDYLAINHNKTRVIMFHFPIAEWDQMHRGAVHFHGHTHGNITGLEGTRALDVGMDATGKTVVSLDKMVEKALSGIIKQYHQTRM